jgi:hypothetical protein
LSSERSEISNAECWPFTKLKFIKYEKTAFCFDWDQKEMFIEFLCDWFIAEKLKEDQLKICMLHHEVCSTANKSVALELQS